MNDTSWLMDRLVDKLRTPGLEADEVKAILLQYEKSREWAETLDGCNFSMARDDIRAALEMRDREAAEKGGTYYYNPEFVTALKNFSSNLCIETAIELLEVSPHFMPMFEMSSPRDPMFNLLESFRRERESGS